MPAAKIPPRPADVLKSLLAWYRANRRDMPWRRTKDPYAVWVSEIMLQQTTVETVVPYYERFLARFPTVEKLARAKLDDVLALWQGLGYYSRARNLHAAAKVVAERHKGKVPSTMEGIRELPGIGPYTAGAILSIAHGRRHPVVDGNVERVLCRYLAIREDPRSAPVRKRLWDTTGAWIQGPAPGDVNQAWMELGATVCVPREPLCLFCPIRKGCRARALGIAAELPAKAMTAARPTRTGTAFVVRAGGKVLLSRRPPEGLLGGLWGFPSEAPLGVSESSRAGRVEHTFTHFHLSLEVRETLLPRAPRVSLPLKWVAPNDLARHALSTLDRKVARAAGLGTEALDAAKREASGAKRQRLLRFAIRA